jgi:hypothetical protein
MLDVVCGADPREPVGLAVFQASVLRHATEVVRFTPLVERLLRREGLYTRPHDVREGRLWCPISDAPMSTDFAISRFLTPWLVSEQWALYADAADMLARDDLAQLFALADERFAIMCVKHRHEPTGDEKMDQQIQTRYARKNWSSLMLWNLSHASNRRLTLRDVNGRPGRDLHRFCWLEDGEIGALPPEWNYLVGASTTDHAPALVHFTEGSPELGYAGPWADEWHAERVRLRGRQAA